MVWWQGLIIVMLFIIAGVALGGAVSFFMLRRAKPIKLGSGLLLVNALNCVLILIIFLFPDSIIRIILAIPFLLFIPGYVLVIALFPKREAIGMLERVTISFGVSMALVPLIGLMLNYSPWGIRLESIVFAVAGFTLLVSAIGLLRLRAQISYERFNIEFQVTLKNWGEGILNGVLITLLVAAVAGFVAILGYVLVTPVQGETYTEFYILEEEGKFADSPIKLGLENEARVPVGIVNHEGRDVTYRVEIAVNAQNHVTVGPLVLADEQRWEGQAVFALEKTGENQKVIFQLYEDGETEPSTKPLHIWVNAAD